MKLLGKIEHEINNKMTENNSDCILKLHCVTN